ncbi:hypothetical protein JMJ77_0012900 [Colletotrichum scovillei]|uniref:Uncharacterized protein n=1 Tax=Colletotrichum scovillei TaxID=1209932 RepID=A0A9P7UEZ4_9PEZI|nr:hypothetical protein JMJ77_0012900 [Colletotrichum scovillei]KAG7069185.1 hypothetical protein JMJ76_0002860 [Colletotrichum scovillei]KAG7073136.1 hypothetical protein JMJ78_0014116 [Colletotrichum scovillei]
MENERYICALDPKDKRVPKDKKKLT